MSSDPFVYLGVPAYGGIHPNALNGLSLAANKYRWYREPECTSATGQTFNSLWARCLNVRKEHGFTHFAMHHSDIESPPDWIDTLLDEMDRVGADVLSVAVPIKNERGLTSSGWMDKKTRLITRFTMRELFQLPETFDIHATGKPNAWLMVNTGLWIAKLGDWVEEFPGFNMVTGVHKDKQGRWRAGMLSEDWNWSMWLGERGLKVFQTRKVPVAHYDGNVAYKNDHAWGTWDHDQDAEPEMEKKEPAKKPLIVGFPGGWSAEKAKPKPLTREIVAVRFAESLAWVHGWLDDILVKHGPNLTYRIYDKGPGGDTPNVGNLDGTYLHHIVTRWDELADWTVFTQADPFPHMNGHRFEELLELRNWARFTWLMQCREWNNLGHLAWDQFPEPWKRRYENGSIRPARLSFREWLKEYLGVDLDKRECLEYHPGAIFGVDRATIHKRPKAFYERLLASLTESGHPCCEEAHYMERSWPLVFAGG